MTMRPTLEQELEGARRSIDQLEDELVLLDTNNRAFREAVRAAAIQHVGVYDRFHCALCDVGWLGTMPEHHRDGCPLSTEPKREVGVAEELRENWQPPVIGPEADTELQRIRDELVSHIQSSGTLRGSTDDYGDHGEDLAWLLDYIAALKRE